MARNREEGLEFMAAEAMRIQVTARYQTEIREAVHRLDSQEEEQDDSILSILNTRVRGPGTKKPKFHAPGRPPLSA